MTNRLYRLIVGTIMLISLYFEIKYVVYFLISMMILEGLTSWSIPKLIIKLRGVAPNVDLNAQSNCKINIEAERAWRLMIGIAFLISYIVFPLQLWVVPWFLAFVIFGAGASDVCPGLLFMKKVGFKS
jgi:hypothetical protein